MLWMQRHLLNWRNFTPTVGKRQTQPLQIAADACSLCPKQSGSVQKYLPPQEEQSIVQKKGAGC